MRPCERCREEPGEISWEGELLCWPCTDRQLDQIEDDAQQGYGTPVYVSVAR